jgi:hypothetical protein
LLSQDFVLSLIEASITGAGLVLAIYALILPLSRTLFEQRVLNLRRDMEEFKKMVDEAKIEVKDAKKLKDLIDKISLQQSFPTYLGLGMGVTFLGYITSTLMSVGWMVEWEKPTMDYWLIPTFALTTIVFLIVGLISIKDIHSIMKRNFERTKRELIALESK